MARESGPFFGYRADFRSCRVVPSGKMVSGFDIWAYEGYISPFVVRGEWEEKEGIVLPLPICFCYAFSWSGFFKI